MSRVTIQEVTVSTITKGKNSYQEANVTYTTDRGENKTKKVLSFSNPAVFATLSKIKNPVTVEYEHNGAPYYNWTKVEPVTEEVPVKAAVAPKSGYVDQRETAEERAKRQVMIVRQSSLGHALTFCELTGLQDIGTDEVINIATRFVDWVMGNDENLETLDSGNQELPET